MNKNYTTDLAAGAALADEVPTTVGAALVTAGGGSSGGSNGGGSGSGSRSGNSGGSGVSSGSGGGGGGKAVTTADTAVSYSNSSSKLLLESDWAGKRRIMAGRIPSWVGGKLSHKICVLILKTNI